MKLVIGTEEYKLVRALQQAFDVTIMSDKGLVFMYRDDWQKIYDAHDNNEAFGCYVASRGD